MRGVVDETISVGSIQRPWSLQVPSPSRWKSMESATYRTQRAASSTASTCPSVSPFRLLQLRGRLICLPCHKFGVVALVDAEQAAQFVTLEDRPTTTHQRGAVSSVPSLPGEFHRRFSFPAGRSAVHQTLDVPELEGATARFLELEERLDLFIEVFILPGGHRDDAPAPRERGFRLLLRHRISLSLNASSRTSSRSPRPACGSPRRLQVPIAGREKTPDDPELRRA